jgi:hypothetical protein
MDEIDTLRAGTNVPAKVHAVSRAAGVLLRSVKVQMEYQRASGREVDIAFMNAEGVDARHATD